MNPRETTYTCSMGLNPRSEFTPGRIVARCNMSKAYLVWGILDRLRGNRDQALAWYARAVAESDSIAVIESAMNGLKEAQPVAQQLPILTSLKTFLGLALALRFGKRSPELIPPTSDAPNLKGPIAAVAGFCGKSGAGEYRKLIQRGFSAFRGTVIS